MKDIQLRDSNDSATNKEKLSPKVLMGKSEITEEEALRLVNERLGVPIILPNLRSLVPSVASILAAHSGELWIGGLSELSFEVAEALANHPLLSLTEVSILTEEIAMVLAKQIGILWLEGLASMSMEVAEILGKHRGPVFVSDQAKIGIAEEQALNKCFENWQLFNGTPLDLGNKANLTDGDL